MNMRTLIGVAGAAALAFGSAAHAIKIDNVYSVTYAKETITKDSERPVTGSGKYYNLAPPHVITGPADIIANGDGSMYEVLFTLQNMVFHGDATLGDNALTRTGTEDDDTAQNWFVISRGGAPGDNFVMFTQNATDNDIGHMDVLTLTAQFAVTADGPGGITRTVTNKALPSGTGLLVTNIHENADAVKVAPTLKVTVKSPTMMPRADAVDNFMSFTGGTTTHSLGTLTIGVESGIRDARVAMDDATEVNVTMVTLAGPLNADGVVEPRAGNTGIVADGILTSASSTSGSAVTFSGDFSFLETLALSDSLTCEGTLTEIRKPSEDDRTVLTDMTMPMAAGSFMSGKTLCVTVDGETAIPSTEAYMATTEFKGPADNMFPPEGGTHNLAMIGRSGSTFRLPFLTVHERHNQRINIVNRGRATTYTLGELATNGDSVSALEMASGDLPPGQTVLLVSDLIEVTGAMRAAGTLSMPADESSLDVSIDIINRENGSSDTVYVEAD